jgi:nucleoside-diphosphate-sugar epimerase
MSDLSLGGQPLHFGPEIAKRLLESDLSVLVTGATGWLGQASLAMLDQCFGAQTPERVFVFSSVDRELPLPSGHLIHAHRLQYLSEMPQRPYLALHYAFLGKEKTAQLAGNEFVARNDAIGDFVCDQLRRLRPVGVFVPSSGAVYNSDRSIDLDLARNPYGAMKARDEQKFFALAQSEAIPTVICRIFNLAGPFINKLQSYALSSVLLDILHGKPIELRNNRPVLRSYFHIGDLCELVCALLLSNTELPEQPFDTAGETEIELGDLADRARQLLGLPDLEIKRPPLDLNAPDRYIGDCRMLDHLLSLHQITARSLNQQITDTADYLVQSGLAAKIA